VREESCHITQRNNAKSEYGISVAPETMLANSMKYFTNFIIFPSLLETLGVALFL
jgi:hypothetical protein